MSEDTNKVEVKPRGFLEHLFGTGDAALTGWLVIAGFPEGKFDPRTGPSQRNWFLWPDDHERALAFIMRNKHKDLYTAPTLYKMKGTAKAKNAKVGRVLYADADTCHPRNFKVVPTMVTETSPGRYQCFWRADTVDGHSPEALSRYSRRVAHNHVNEGCDATGFAIGHLMRIPASSNNKPSVGQWTVRAAADPERVVNAKQVKDAYPQVEPPPKTQSEPLPSDLPDQKTAEEAINGNALMLELYSATGTQGSPTASRSHILWKLVCELSRLGIDKKTALVLAMHATSNKWKNHPQRGMEEIWRQVVKAYNDPENQPPVDAEDYARLEHTRDREDRSITVEDGKVVAAVPLQGTPVQLLDDDEYPLVPRDTLVDTYERWAMQHTDAAVQFHRAAILSVLSTILGDFGRPGASFMKDAPLNLWFLVLGATTRSRKTTSRRYATKILEDVQRPPEYKYRLGGDVTAEGLNNELADFPGRSKLLDRDEAHGWFQEMQSKPYMYALKEVLAGLYDGETQGRLRAAADKNKGAVATSLNMFLLGITDMLCEQLEASDYASGFLNRFIYVHAPPPPRTPQSVQVNEVDPDDNNLYVDAERENIVEQLSKLQQYWAEETGHAPGVTNAMAVITSDDDALQRFNRFAMECADHAADHPLADVLEPAADRLTKSVLKCVYLLAMSNQRRKANIGDVRKVLSWAEHWYGDLIYVAHHVHANSWSRRVDEVQRKLAEYTGTSVPWQRIYNKVRRDFNPKAFKEVIMALQQSGLVTVENGNNGGTVITKIDW